MHIIVYGAGAIGGYLGARLAQSGQSVALVTREPGASLINAEGLTVTEGDETITCRVPAFATLVGALEARPPDLLILAMKSYDLDEALPPMVAVPPSACLLTMQNGIGVEERVAADLPANPLVAAAITVPIRKTALNRLVVEKSSRGVGLAGVRCTPEALQSCAALYRTAGISTQVLPDYREMKWSKAFLNIMGNASSAILNRPPAQLYPLPEMYDLEMEMLREALAIMSRLGLRVINLPGSQAAPLAFGVRSGPRFLMRPIMQQVVLRGRGDKMPSFYLDLASGTGLSEVVFHNGAIAEAGRQIGLPAPVNETLSELLMAMTLGTRDRAEFDGRPDRLIAEVRKHRTANHT